MAVGSGTTGLSACFLLFVFLARPGRIAGDLLGPGLAFARVFLGWLGGVSRSGAGIQVG